MEKKSLHSLAIITCCSLMFLGVLIPILQARADDQRSSRPCGTSGTVEQRINDCSKYHDSRKAGFVLVTRTRDAIEVHVDVATGLLWSDRLPDLMTHYQAEEVCLRRNSAFAGLTDRRWRLPTAQDYVIANKNGMRKALPNMDYHRFWTSNISKFNQFYAVIFDGKTGKPYQHSNRLHNDGFTRCIAISW
jgi:hypothetical protein